MVLTKSRILLVGLVVVGLAASPLMLRHCASLLGEPSFAEWVEMTADWLASTSAGPELEALADQLMKEHAHDAAELREAEFSNGGRELPVERLPEKFRERGGGFGEPQLFIRLDANSRPELLVVSWGHTRQAILVYRKPPTDPPGGFLVRAASARIYVVADEKWSSTAPVGKKRED